MGSNGLTPGKVHCRVDLGVPDCIPLAIIHTVHPENETVKQQTSYLFGKENIHQAMVKKNQNKKTKWNQYGDTVK